MKQVLRLFLVMLFCCEAVFWGGGFGKVATGVALGVATGGLSVVTGATTAAAVATGIASGASYIATGTAAVGVNMDGNGNNPTVVAGFPGPEGVSIGVDTGKFNYPDREIIKKRPWEKRFEVSDISAEQREQESQEAKSSFNIEYPGEFDFGIKSHDGRKYHVATSEKSTLLTTMDRGKWKTSVYKGFDSFSTFEPTSEIEKLAIKSFRFEETPLAWHFSRELLDGKWYNRAFTDTLYDIMVPENEIHYIAAPKWYTEMRLAKKQEAEARARERQDRVIHQQKESVLEAAMRGYHQEALWANLSSINYAGNNDHERSLFSSQIATQFRDKAVEVFESIQRVATDFIYDLSLPGGYENEQRHGEGLISDEEYLNNIAIDEAIDLSAILTGAIVGGGEGLALSTASGGTLTVPTVAVCAAKGALKQYIVAKAVKSTGRILISESRGNGSEGDGKKYRAVEPTRGNWHSLDRGTRLGIQKKFVDKRVADRKWAEPAHKIGGRDAWRDLDDKTIYYTKDTKHGDIEVWKVSGKRAEHQGSMEAIDGTMYRKPNHDPQLFE